ncbi:MAG: hypothetical protein B7C24_05470 [Bacteroidetes bacterium 4572_77]|nr:MAG: hypothetical protein B7C24_05470 [Bacteroidetes bacterium 4572_77]
MYLNSISTEKQLQKEYRKKAFTLHPDRGGSEKEFIQLAREYKFWKNKLLAKQNNFNRIKVGDTVWVNKTECEITFVNQESFIARAKGRVKFELFDRETGIGINNAKYRAALMKEYFYSRNNKNS